MDEPFIGDIELFAFGYAPADWHLCDGTSLSVAQNQVLYALIGNRFGGDNVNFNLPNLQTAVPLKASHLMNYYICMAGIYPSRT